MDNKLYYGDNLGILRDRRRIADESVDLIYLDPPFNSRRNYNVLFKNERGTESEAQILAFEDTWHWNEAAEQTYHELVTLAPPDISTMIVALRSSIGSNQMMAYLVMMAARLVEMHRVLKSGGSIYLHCDPTASHYLKVLMDGIFGVQHFQNEIIWHYSGWNKPNLAHFMRRHDIILYYSKGQTPTFQTFSVPYASKEEYLTIRKQHVFKDEDGREYTLDTRDSGTRQVRVYVDEALARGKPCDDVWEIDKLNNSSKERLGYPTQKPEALLERIIATSSNPGDVVLDPFCGCGTAIAAAQKLGRRWIGIDITHLSIALLKYRLEAMFPGIHVEVDGEPKDLDAARHLAQSDRYQFQWWALSLIRAKPLHGQEGSKVGKKGSDKGIDGVIDFIDDASGAHKRIIVQVKSGHVKSGDIRDLVGTLAREKAEMAVFLTLEDATRDMEVEALSAGYYTSPWGTHPRIQILTIQDLLAGVQVNMPPQSQVSVTFKRPPRAERAPQAAQPELELADAMD